MIDNFPIICHFYSIEYILLLIQLSIFNFYSISIRYQEIKIKVKIKIIKYFIECVRVLCIGLWYVKPAEYWCTKYVSISSQCEIKLLYQMKMKRHNTIRYYTKKRRQTNNERKKMKMQKSLIAFLINSNVKII